ncbi:MAG: NAD(P)-dependent oxidoreductase [Paracoccus sp. (in: a-proteobacteria)]
MANVALIGASGNVGTRLVKELSDRGHQVSAIARSPEKIAALPGVTAKAGDLFDAPALAALLAGHDAVISAVGFVASDPEKLLEAVRASNVRRYLVVGGAGSLESAPGQRLIDGPDFPEAYRAEAEAGAAYLDRLRVDASDLDWTFLSPSALFFPGTRSGSFRLGGNQLLVNEQGSSISFEDYAIAMVDELERPAHIRQRFTVGY